VTGFNTNNRASITQNSDGVINRSGIEHRTGLHASVYSDAYLADIHFIDGQALTPSSFGETNATTGVWTPKAYTGTYGTNGFRLDFSDNSASTATTLGKDRAGSNNWTPVNLSVTAGSGNDSLVDSPTSYGADTGAGGEVRGNYCTWGAIYIGASGLSNGNLDASVSATNAFGTFSLTSGKWYWEVLVTSAPNDAYIGIMDSTFSIANSPSWSIQGRSYRSTGAKYDGTSQTYGSSYGNGSIIGFALDLDAGTLVFYNNGVSQGTAFSSGLIGKEWRPHVYGNPGTFAANFGQRPFAYTAPSGFKALCAANLPAPTIVKPSTAMDVVTYTGNGSSQTISGLGFSPDLVWVKGRNVASNHGLYDIVRGASRSLISNETLAEQNYTGYGVNSFNSSGFTVADLPGYGVNDLNKTYAAWCWDAGSSTVTNTSGTISSQVRANASAGFSIITFSIPTGGSCTVGHSLGVAPEFYIVKSRVGTSSWVVYHKLLGSSKYLLLNSTAAETTSVNAWSNTAPTSTVFSIGSDFSGFVGAAVAYAFAPVSSYSAFGSYTGNGSADGPFVYTGFRPRWVIIKYSSAIDGNWIIYDSSRGTNNLNSKKLGANYSFVENNDTYYGDDSFGIDFLSNGFKIRTTGLNHNISSGAYIYAAFAEHPFSLARAR
jgi:hypothetical protein